MILSPARAAFSLVLRSKNQVFSWGEWAFVSRDATSFLSATRGVFMLK